MTQQDHLQILTDAIVDHYLDLENTHPEDAPDPVKDARFAQFTIASADDPYQAALAYLADAEVSPEVHQFLAEYGTGATFGDLWAAISPKR